MFGINHFDVLCEEVFYRYSDYRTAPGVDEFGDPIGEGYPHLSLEQFKIIKRTPKGTWIEFDAPESGVGKKFVLSDARKKFAHPTKEEALVSFLARKKRQKQIYSARISHIVEVMVIAEKELSKLGDDVFTKEVTLKQEGT